MLKTGRPRTQAVLTRLWDMKTFCSKRAFRKTPPSYSFSSVISMFCQNHLRQRVAWMGSWKAKPAEQAAA